MVTFTVYKGSSSGNIVQGIASREIGPRDVLVRITYSGLCGTDVHVKGQDIGLGYEGAGIVEDVGNEVKLFKNGDCAGWGYLQESCRHCKQCLCGAETFCPDRKIYGEANLDQGSMGSHAVWTEDFLFLIPDNIPNGLAAPLMCGGATVFNALQLHGVKSTDVVGVIGFGGIGHLAVQFARAFGCDVVVLFSGTDGKKEDAERQGATEFHSVKGAETLKGKVTPIDHLLVTTSQQPDWDLYLPVMAPSGTIYPLTVGGKIAVEGFPLILSGLRIQGSMVSARLIHRQMLEFASKHGINPLTQEFPLSVEGIEEAFRTLDNGRMRYRGVLVA